MALAKSLAIINDFANKIKEQAHLPQISDFYLYKELSEFRKNIISKNNTQIKRIFSAFPNFEFKEFKQQIRELKLDLHKFKAEIEQSKKNKELKKLKEKN